MPRTQSATRALRESARRRTRNINRQKQVKDAVKQLQRLLDDGKQDEARTHLSKLYKTIDKATKVNFMKRGTANRIKSRLTKRTQKKQK